jgi:hypothetical protein
MEANDVKNLMEAYTSVYSPQEEVEQLDEASPRISRSMGRRATEYRRNQEQDAHMKRVNAHQEKMKNDPEYREKHENARKVHQRDQNESYDLFDTILEHLVAEGYADTNEAAIAIMANMSEEWKQSIIEQSAIGARAAKVVDDQRQGYHGDMDAINKMSSDLSKSMGRLKRGQGPVVTPGLPGV